MTSRGRRNGGTPASAVPPAWSSASTTVTPKPSFARSDAAESPAHPAPTTATVPRGGPKIGDGGCVYERPSVRTFWCVQSDRNFLTYRIERGLSTSLRRQAVSHGAAQTEPQIDAIGFGSSASSHAFSNSPAAARFR